MSITTKGNTYHILSELEKAIERGIRKDGDYSPSFVYIKYFLLVRQIAVRAFFMQMLLFIGSFF